MEPSSLKDLINTQRAELTNKYFPPRNKSLLSKLLQDDRYKQTQELAYHSISFGKQYVIKNSVIALGFNLLIFHGVQVLMYAYADTEDRRSRAFIIVETVLAIAAIFFWKTLLANKPRVKIDDTGIEIIYSGDKIEWKNIAMTYIRTDYVNKTSTDYLVINYYAPWNNGFEEKEIDLTNLATTKANISSAVEYYKKGKIV